MQELQKYAAETLEAPLFGVAMTEKLWLHPDYEFLRNKFQFAVVIGYKISYGITDTLIDGPNQLYLAYYRQVNYLLDRSATRITQWIEMHGHNAVPIAATQIIDWKSQLGILSHRHAAVEAGLAWWGRNNLAVTVEFGSHQRWATILTDMPLKPGKPHEMDCGECRACIEMCPAGAIGDTAHDFDRNRCIEILKSFGKRGIGHYICGMCIKPCKGKKPN